MKDDSEVLGLNNWTDATIISLRWGRWWEWGKEHQDQGEGEGWEATIYLKVLNSMSQVQYQLAS